jgi:hypothetical protein
MKSGQKLAPISINPERAARLGLLEEPIGWPDGPSRYEAVLDDPESYVDPTGLSATTQQGPVNVTVRGQTIHFEYSGDDIPTFYQTVQVILPPSTGTTTQGSGPSTQTSEQQHHGGADPTKGPIGDNGSGVN